MPPEAPVTLFVTAVRPATAPHATCGMCILNHGPTLTHRPRQPLPCAGTGKTTVVVAYLVALSTSCSASRVLVCAPSNRGVQEVCDRYLAARPAEDDVVLIGDADRVPEDAPCARVFVYSLAERWSRALHAVAAVLTDEADAAACKVGTKEKMSAAFCSSVDCACVVRISHTEACSAARQCLNERLHAARARLCAIRSSIRARHPYSWGTLGLSTAFEEADAALDATSSTVEAVAERWPCQLRAAGGDLSSRFEAAALAVLAAARVVADGLRSSVDAHAEALGSARFVFCTCATAGCYLVRNMPSVSHLIVDEAAQATEPEAIIPLSCLPRRMLLAGDPCQLCCVCVSRRASAAGLERQVRPRSTPTFIWRHAICNQL